MNLKYSLTGDLKRSEQTKEECDQPLAFCHKQPLVELMVIAARVPASICP
jgi:hypothetical protein